MYKKAVYFAPDKFKWFDLALVEHTLHYALSEKNSVTEEVAKEAKSMLEAMLGDRLVNHPTTISYAAVITKGLIDKHVEVDFMDRVNEAIGAREHL